MQKSMYSLMLADDVVKEIDALASEKNTNRSNLINQILAEYASLITPEKQINNIFNYVDGLLNNDIFSSIIEPYESIMCVKSSLDYKYRPTVKYSVELYRNPTNTLGELRIRFRTQVPELLMRLENFFKAWAKMESAYLYEYYGITVQYAQENGKFSRSIALPVNNNFDSEIIARGISDYIAMLDGIIKNYLADKYGTFAQIEQIYLQYLSDENSVII